MRFRCEAEWNELAALSLHSSRECLDHSGDRLFSGKAIEIA